MARGRCLNTSIVLVAVHGLSGLFRVVLTVEPSLFHLLPPLSPFLISHLASVDVKRNGLVQSRPPPWKTTPIEDQSAGGGGGGGDRQNKKKHTKRTSWFHVFEYTKEMWAGDRVCQFSLAHVLVHKLPTLATKMLCKFALASCSLVTVACMCILMWCC